MVEIMVVIGVMLVMHYNRMLFFSCTDQTGHLLEINASVMVFCEIGVKFCSQKYISTNLENLMATPGKLM